MTDKKVNLIERLQSIQTGQFMDAIKKYKEIKQPHQWSFNYTILPSHLRPFRPLEERKKVMAGFARTAHSEDGFFGMLLGLYQSKKNEVLVINGTSLSGTLGEIVCYEAVNRGLSGLINIGYIRDSYTIIHDKYLDDLPIFADNYNKNIIPYAKAGGLKDFKGKSKKEMLKYNENTPIMIDQTYMIKTGDIILGDNDGIILINNFDKSGEEFYKEMKIILQISDNITETEDEIMFNIKTRKQPLYEIFDIDGMIDDLKKGIMPHSPIKAKL
eukprot:253615_1